MASQDANFSYDTGPVCAALRRVHQAMQAHLMRQLREQSVEVLSRPAGECPSDVIYHIDRSVEGVLLQGLEAELASLLSFVLVCEGIGELGEPLTFPPGTPVERCQARVIIDPIDGTRAIMYDKRSAWILTGVAPNLGEATSLRDINIAVQTEVPTTRAAWADAFWTVRGHGVRGESLNLLTGEARPARPRPSQAHTIEGGFAMLVHFFPLGKKLLSEIEEEVIAELLGEGGMIRPIVFDDQYISTGGQFYELLVGHDRMIGDVRGLLNDRWRREGRPAGMTCHPYDACTALILEEAGVTVCRPDGHPLDHRLTTTGEVSWVGYANEHLRRSVEPVLQRRLRAHGLL